MTLWLGLLLSMCVMAAFVLSSWRRGVRMAELGTVSAQWLAEQREYDRHYSDR